MLTAAEIRSLLASRGVRLTKRLGQHLLVDPATIRRIIERCELSARDTVVEIGPGLGALTEPLAARAGQVIAVDIDRGICSLLAQRLEPLVKEGRLAIRCQDILGFSWNGLSQVTVVGAIPYHITSPILVSLGEARQAIRRAILVVQEEVARRLLAKPGTKSYGRLSVLVQYRWDASRLLAIPRRAFFPEPRVDSSCVQLIRRHRPPVALVDEPFFFGVVKAAFSHRRKTLVNSLMSGPRVRLDRPRAEALVRKLGLPAAARGETLSLTQFASLANALAGERSAMGQCGG
jgi:16S rRNA (adenine1518-N6/adenine1519-N6)-dimethyltransferase